MLTCVPLGTGKEHTMSVKKIFITLVVIVMCIILGAFLINVFLPNATAQVINAAEDAVYKSTGMQFDFNADGHKGQNNEDYSSDGVGHGSNADEIYNSGAVDGFQ